MAEINLPPFFFYCLALFTFSTKPWNSLCFLFLFVFYIYYPLILLSLSLGFKEPAGKNFGGGPLHNIHPVWATPNKQTANKVRALPHAHAQRHIFSPLPLLIPSFFHLELSVLLFFLSLSTPLPFPYPSIYSSCENLLPSPLSHGQRGE